MSQIKLQHNQLENIQRTLLLSIKDEESQYSVNFSCKDGRLSCSKLVLALSNDYWRDLMTSSECATISILAPEYNTDYIKDFLHSCVFGNRHEKKTFENEKKIVEEDNGSDTIDQQKLISKFKVARKNDCPYCLKHFSYGYLKYHIKNVHKKSENKNDNKCESCDQNFTSKGGLKAHIESNHKNKNPHICRTCQSVYLNKKHLIRHCISEGHKFPKEDPHPKDFTTCKICNKKIRSDCMDIHMEIRHPQGNEREHKCPECNFKTKRKDSLQRHKQLVHKIFNRDVCAVEKTWSEGKEYQCVFCKKMLINEDDISDHLIFEICRLTCSICNKQFTLKSNLDRHMKKFHK